MGTRKFKKKKKKQNIYTKINRETTKSLKLLNAELIKFINKNKNERNTKRKKQRNSLIQQSKLYIYPINIRTSTSMKDKNNV